MIRKVPRTVWLLLLVGAAILVPFAFFGEPIERWCQAAMEQGTFPRWQGAGLLFALLALDIFLPVPSSLATTWCGVLLGCFGGFLLSFAAMTVSALLGIALGRWSAPLAARMIGAREQQALESFFARAGLWVLIALRAVPVLAEASVLFAGVVRMPLRQAVPMILLGNAVVSLVYAWVGSWGRSADAMVPAFLASMVISGILMLVARRWGRSAH